MDKSVISGGTMPGGCRRLLLSLQAVYLFGAGSNIQFTVQMGLAIRADDTKPLRLLSTVL